MSTYAYVAVDPTGSEMRGTVEVGNSMEAIRRIKEMGLFPTKVAESGRPLFRKVRHRAFRMRLPRCWPFLRTRIRLSRLAVFTRQLATLTEAGMPLLRGLRILQEQEESRVLRRVLQEAALSIENGSSLSEAVSAHPRIFSPLYVSMVKAGELGGALEVTLTRLAEFMEKSERIKSRIKAAMFYPAAVLVVAGGIMGVLMAFVIPRFRALFVDLLNGQQLPAFTRFVFGLSDLFVHRFWVVGLIAAALLACSAVFLKTAWGRLCWDRFKLVMPVLGTVFRKAAISRFARTLGTLSTNGVPILQALSIVKETAGNLAVGNIVSEVAADVKGGEPIAPTLRRSGIFPAMVAGMVDVGEQTGALPEMLLKIADTYDEEVNNSTNALTSLLEPVMIVVLAVLVGSIVIAMFLPITTILNFGFDAPPQRGGE